MKADENRVVRTNVPTLDVDLFWHAYQLFPSSYHCWCESYLGRRVNHDDTMGEKSSKEEFEATKKICRTTYNSALSVERLLGNQNTSQKEHRTEHADNQNEESSPELKNECHDSSEDAESSARSFTDEELHELIDDIVSNEDKESSLRAT